MKKAEKGQKKRRFLKGLLLLAAGGLLFCALFLNLRKVLSAQSAAPDAGKEETQADRDPDPEAAGDKDRDSFETAAANGTYEGAAAENAGSGEKETGTEEAEETPRPAAREKSIFADFHFPKDLVEEAEPPLSVDWAELKETNPDIIGWIYVEALPQISYPVCQSGDNDYYLHHNYLQEAEYAGSIFADAINTEDFADPNTLLFGHNMRNGSMFGSLKFLYTEGAVSASPWFWILTPEGNYRYHIFSMFYTDVDSDVYLLYSYNGVEFLAWEEDMKAASLYENDVPLYPWDKTVYMSTCTSDSEKRFVVFGKCVSGDRPHRDFDYFASFEEGHEEERDRILSEYEEHRSALEAANETEEGE